MLSNIDSHRSCCFFSTSYMYRKYNAGRFLLIAPFVIILASSGCSLLSHKQKAAGKTAGSDSARVDNSEKKYKSLLKDALTQKGFITVHQVKADYYFELPISVMNKDILLVNKISSVPLAVNEAGLNKGMNYENKVIRFSVNKLAGTVWVSTYQPQVEVPKGDAIARSVNDNFSKSVIESFKIESYNKDSSSVLIKVNRVFDGTEKSFNDVFTNIGFGTSPKTALSSIRQIKAFEKNIVVKSLLSTSVTEDKVPMPVSVDVTTNILLLPEQPMIARFADPRIGFFTTPRWYFSDDQHKMEDRNLVTRWRLEPRPEDVARYKRGELVEPAKPIVYYIDPATPAKWRKYIIAGVFDWQSAFERAGFKNAIIAKEVENPDSFDGDDVNNSLITYAASPRSNAMGPSVVDPRSGEIIEADVIWWHNVMTSVQEWMRVQTGIIDPKARTNRLSDEQMGAAIRFVSSHEIGHTLGLKHNMASSASFPVDSLRSASFTSRMGGTAPSIMDYARFNYVAQPGDHVTSITPKIGEYDKYAIAWAYRWLDEKDPHDELNTLRRWIKEKENNPVYRYGEQQELNNVIDPRSQSEDLGDNSVLASEYGLKNLKRLVPQIVSWTTRDGEDYYNAGKLFMAVINQWATYADHVTANVGGLYLENPVAGDHKDAYSPVPPQRQRQALQYIREQVLNMPQWLFNNDLLRKTFPLKDTPMGASEYGPYNIRRAYQYGVIYSLISDERLMRMLESELLFGKDKVLTVSELLKTLRSEVFKSSLEGRTLGIEDRMLQQNYVDALLVSSDKALEKISRKTLDDVRSLRAVSAADCGYANTSLSGKTNLRSIYTTSMVRTSDVAAQRRAELLRVLNILKASQYKGDENTQGHYQDLILRINQSLGIR